MKIVENILVGFLLVSGVQGQERAVEWSGHFGWDSRYLSEGRDELDGDSLITGAVGFSWEYLFGEIWYGVSPDQNYDELQITLGLAHSFGDFEVYGGYTHLRFPFDDSTDNEIGAGVAWSGLPLDLVLAVDAAYSFDADGYFAEVSASREIALRDDFSLGLLALLGVNQGFVSDGSDGANNFALQTSLEYSLTESISLVTQATFSWAIDRDAALPGDEQLTDFFHGGVALQWSPLG